MKSAARFVLAMALALVVQQLPFGSSIVTLPTADVAPVGAVDIAAYHWLQLRLGDQDGWHAESPRRDCGRRGEHSS